MLERFWLLILGTITGAVDLGHESRCVPVHMTICQRNERDDMCKPHERQTTGSLAMLLSGALTDHDAVAAERRLPWLLYPRDRARERLPLLRSTYGWTEILQLEKYAPIGPAGFPYVNCHHKCSREGWRLYPVGPFWLSNFGDFWGVSMRNRSSHFQAPWRYRLRRHGYTLESSR